MMHAVHVGCDDDPSEPPVDRSRQVDVGMVEEGSGVEDDLEQQNRDGGRTKRCHQGELDGHRDEDLNRMEA